MIRIVLLTACCAVSTLALCAADEPLVIEAEDFTTVSALRMPKDKPEWIKFSKPEHRIETPFQMEKKKPFSIWARVNYKSRGASAFFVSVDGRKPERIAVNGEDYNRWHWICLGYYEEVIPKSDLPDFDGTSEEMLDLDPPKPDPSKKTEHLTWGNHTVALCAATPIPNKQGQFDAPGIGLCVDKILFYFDNAPKNEKWWLEDDFAIFSMHLDSSRMLSARFAVSIEAEQADRVSAAAREDAKASAGNAVEFRNDEDEIALAIETAADLEAEVWVRAYFDAANRVAGDANSFRFYLDGVFQNIVSDSDLDRWHWVRAGKYALAKGRHIAMLRSQALPVRIDKLVFHVGADAHGADWFTALEPMAALKKSIEPGPDKTLDASNDHVALEPEDGVMDNCHLQTYDDEVGQAAVFEEAAGFLHLAARLAADDSPRALVLVKCEEAPARFTVYIDGELKKTLVLNEPGKWVFLDAGEYALQAGTHLLSVRPLTAGLAIGGVVLYTGEDARKEKWFQKHDRLAYLLFSDEVSVAPDRMIESGQTSVFIDMADADVLEKAVVEPFDEQGKAVVFREKGAEAHIFIELKEPAAFELWALTRHDRRFQTAYERNLLTVSLDGQTPPAGIRNSFSDEWQWTGLGRYQFAAGRHVLSFGGRSLPLRISKLVLYAGANAAAEAWYSGIPRAYSLPFDLPNNISQKEADHISHWRIFGGLAGKCRFSLSRDVRHKQERSVLIEFPAGNSGQHLVLQRRVSLRTPEAFVENNLAQQVVLCVRGDASSLVIKGVCRDAQGEAFEGIFAGSETGADWNELRMNIGGDSRHADLRSEGAFCNGVVDYPLELSWLIFEPRNADASRIYFEEPTFARPFVCGAKPVDGGEIGVGDRIKVEFAVKNEAESANQADLVFLFGPDEGEPGEKKRVPVSVPGHSAITQRVELIADRAGVYELCYGIGASEPKRLYLGAGPEGAQALAHLVANLEKKHGAFHFSPDGSDMALRMPDGKTLDIGTVKDAYGDKSGIFIYADGKDVCSDEYALEHGLRGLAAKGYDLSDSAGWPAIRVEPGDVAIDPRLGRFKFAEGDSNRVGVVSRYCTGFGVPGAEPVIRGDYVFYPPGEGDITIIDISDKKNPRVVSYLETWSFCYDAYFYKHLLYYTENRGAQPYMANVNDPINPFDLRQANFTGRIQNIWESEDLAYIAHDGKMNIASLKADAARPEIIGKIPDSSSFVLSPDRRRAFTYSADRTRIRVLDVTHPRSPEVLSEIANISAEDRDEKGNPITLRGEMVAVSRSILALRLKNDIILFDISDPSAPFRRGTYSVSASSPIVLTGFGIYGDRDCYDHAYLYALDARRKSEGAGPQEGRIFVLDVTDLDNPSLVYTLLGPPFAKYNAIKIEGEYAYVGDRNFGLRIFDLHNPQVPEEVGKIPTAAEGHFLEIHNSTVYMVNTFGATMYAIDVADPVNPRQVGIFWDGCWFPYICGPSGNVLAGAGNAVYLAKTGGTIQILDVSDRARIKEVGRIQGGYFHVRDETLFAMEVKSLAIYDISDPFSPRLISRLNLPWRAALPLPPSGDLLCLVCDRGRTLAAVNISDLNSPRIAGSFSLDEVGEEDEEMFGMGEISRGYVYLTSTRKYNTSLYILDIRDPEKIRFVRRVDPMGGKHGLPSWGNFYEELIVSGDYLFISNYGQVEVIDISDPENPRFVDYKRMGYQWSEGRLQGEYLYVPTLNGLCVLDVPHSSQIPTGVVTAVAGSGGV